MKRIRCNRNICAIKINHVIVNFESDITRRDKTALVDEVIAKELLKKEGFEFIKEDKTVNLKSESFIIKTKKYNLIDFVKSFIIGIKK